MSERCVIYGRIRWSNMILRRKRNHSQCYLREQGTRFVYNYCVASESFTSISGVKPSLKTHIFKELYAGVITRTQWGNDVLICLFGANMLVLTSMSTDSLIMSRHVELAMRDR